MKKCNKNLILISILLILVFLTAGTVRPQISEDEMQSIIEAVIGTLSANGMTSSAAATAVTGAEIGDVYEELLQKAADQTKTVTGTEAAGSGAAKGSSTVVPVAATAVPKTAATPSGTNARVIDKPSDYVDGAVQQSDGTYRGLHAKFSNSYSYADGTAEDGVIRTFGSRYIPNQGFTIDIIFENDGSVIWPAQLELRHIGTSGEYTGHRESVYLDRSSNPVMPGDKAGFSVSAHGSEGLGWHTFYFQVYDALSGTPIEGGSGSYTYLAY